MDFETVYTSLGPQDMIKRLSPERGKLIYAHEVSAKPRKVRRKARGTSRRPKASNRILEGVGLKGVIDVRRPADGQEAVLRAEFEDGEIWEGRPVGRLPWPGELMRELLTQAHMDYEAHQARHPGLRYGMTQLEQWRHDDEWERLQETTWARAAREDDHSGDDFYPEDCFDDAFAWGEHGAM